MTGKIESKRNKTFWSVLLPLSAFLLVLSQPQQVSAQWTAPDAAGNINSTNTGSVTIGSPSPPTKGKLEVRADYGVALGEHGLLYVTRSGQGSGGVFMGYRANGTAATGGYLRGTANLPLFVGTTGSPEAMTIADSGNVGIRTTSPGLLNGVSFSSYVPLHIQGTAATFVVVDSATSNSGFVINDSSQALDNRIWGVSQAAGGGKLTFSTYTDAGVNSDKLVIDRTGNVGIGTSAPTSKLHVDGDITVAGNINAKYQDVAEWVPSEQQLAAGTVVVIDPVRSNHVLASTSSYDTSVAGVISAKPGLSLGEAGAGKALVATTGRVKVRVDATRAPVRIGDLLVTSDVAGVAMKSEPISVGGRRLHAPGTIIGKALEPLDKGTGEILVLLSLQ